MALKSLGLHELSPYVFAYEPGRTHSTPVRASDPKLILLAAWMDAQDAHIAKYIAHYQSIYPSAAMLLVKFGMKEAVLAPVANSVVRVAVWYLGLLVKADQLSPAPDRPEILAHVFSNGGATSMQHIYASYSRRYGQPFPLHCTVLDSCPGLHAFSRSYNALTAGFPRGLLRFIVAPFIVWVILITWVLHNPLSFIAGEDFLSKNSRILNDDSLVKQTNRTYIYGQADAMVDWHHIEKHAENAAAKGFRVRKEMFENSPHVAHMRTDSQRYWLIVEETWKKAIAATQ
ncbi:hypothetical protein GGS24DRAFT_53905 [Hypoxylon argillaceum]|nr:hypothetical protein GGS24DRAFT_53905 [Hypoxylon argillaceum]KAI1151804.1 hypothetical protein F4825DRAFT_462301 [Nemania diffusa]